VREGRRRGRPPAPASCGTLVASDAAALLALFSTGLSSDVGRLSASMPGPGSSYGLRGPVACPPGCRPRRRPPQPQACAQRKTSAPLQARPCCSAPRPPRTKLVLEALLGLHVGAGHDAGVVEQHVNLAVRVQQLLGGVPGEWVGWVGRVGGGRGLAGFSGGRSGGSVSSRWRRHQRRRATARRAAEAARAGRTMRRAAAMLRHGNGLPSRRRGRRGPIGHRIWCGPPLVHTPCAGPARARARPPALPHLTLSRSARSMWSVSTAAAGTAPLGPRAGGAGVNRPEAGGHQLRRGPMRPGRPGC
jgi:hypothetical protein